MVRGAADSQVLPLSTLKIVLINRLLAGRYDNFLVYTHWHSLFIWLKVDPNCTKNVELGMGNGNVFAITAISL